MNDSPEWTVLTWNVHGSHRPDISGLATAIKRETPDVVALQEIRRSQASSLASELGMQFSWARKHSPYTRAIPWLTEGMAIMSPHALGAAGHTELSQSQRSWSWRRRIVQWALVGRADSSAYLIYNTHLSPHNAPSERRAEALRLADLVAEHGDETPVIVAGDFNDAHDGSIIYALPGVEHIVPTNTNPASSPDQLLDHVLLPANAHHVTTTVPAGGRNWAELSDHLPVTVRFQL
ncbi:MAG: endonuclease/exonuclease/phosphatase family protein [Ilumatobacteraceae bacterium]|nr:endonuclease/exonuclease/phosphatase family protein [Ilumatobacteraceae bacterium]